MMIQFFAGEGRCYKSVNYLIGEDREKGISIYAEVEIPEDISDDYDLTIDYGYLTMKKAIIQCLPAEVLEQIEWFYDNDEYLPEDASADCDVYLDCDYEWSCVLAPKTTPDGMTDLQVLLSTGMSERDAEKHLKNGTSVFRSVNQWADAQKTNGYWDGLVEEAETDDPNLMIERLGDREITSDGYVIEYVL